jgi:hypothetical protein
VGCAADGVGPLVRMGSETKRSAAEAREGSGHVYIGLVQYEKGHASLTGEPRGREEGGRVG